MSRDELTALITPTDLTPLEAVPDLIDREVLAVQWMAQLRWDLIRLRGLRQVAIKELVEAKGATWVARTLKISRETVYNLLEADPRYDEVLEMAEAPLDESLDRRLQLVGQLAENERLFENVARGKTPSIPPGPVGARLLADLLRRAREQIEVEQSHS